MNCNRMNCVSSSLEERPVCVIVVIVRELIVRASPGCPKKVEFKHTFFSFLLFYFLTAYARL